MKKLKNKAILSFSLSLYIKGSQDIYIIQQRRVIFKIWKTNGVRPMSYTGGIFQAVVLGIPNQRTMSFWVKIQRKSKWIEFAAESNYKERTVIEEEKPRDLQRIHLRYSVEYRPTYTYKENTQEKKERIKWKVLLLSHLSHVRLLATPWTAAY